MRLVDEAIETYAAEHASEPPPLLEALQAETRERTSAPQMMIGPLEGNVLRMLIRLMGARRIVEVGTFTGYSALCMASALPADGRIVTCEIDEFHASIAQRWFEQSPDGDKIELRLGPALDTLRTLESEGFDLIFIDADKTGYAAYYEEALRLLRPGGLVVADNVLWSGRVLDPQDESSHAIVAFNEMVQMDPRVDHVMLTIRDGMYLARKK